MFTCQAPARSRQEPPTRISQGLRGLVWSAGPPGEGAGMKGGDLLRAALAGGIASSASTLTLHPLDTLKTRIQVGAVETFHGV